MLQINKKTSNLTSKLFVDDRKCRIPSRKARGEGLIISYGFLRSPFGQTLIMISAERIIGLAFTGKDAGSSQVLDDMLARWPRAEFKKSPKTIKPYGERIFSPDLWDENQPLPIMLIGTDFDIMVWDALLDLSWGENISYSDLAKRLGKPRAGRAVGSAVGRNPISFIVPCHRVLRKDGHLGGYHWGLGVKRSILKWEAQRGCP